MPAIVDLRGNQFGRLRIPRDAEPESRNGRAYWPCVCECGAQVWVATNKLRLGRTVSCGCYRADPEVRKMPSKYAMVVSSRWRSAVAASAVPK
jgi:hypothetical protein